MVSFIFLRSKDLEHKGGATNVKKRSTVRKRTTPLQLWRKLLIRICLRESAL